MALGANHWSLNASATANNVNGGGFNPANANFLTDLACDTNTGNTNSPVVSSASYNFVAGDVGALVYIKSGTNWTPGFYEIASVATNKATLKAAVGEASQGSYGVWSTNTVAGCATVGTPTSGTFGIDYGPLTAAIGNGADLASSNGTTNPSTVTSATVTFGANHVGNVIHVTAGTSWTAGWYEIVSVSGGAATLDRAVGSAASLSNGTFYVGGAMSLNSTLDDDLFENSIAGCFWWIKSGTYSLGETVTTAVAGSASNKIAIQGFNTVRGDAPTEAQRPYFDNTVVWTPPASADLRDLHIEGTAASVVSLLADSKLERSKVVNKSTTSSRAAVEFTGARSICNQCEVISYRGDAVKISGSATANSLRSCYLHDSNNGVNVTITDYVGVYLGNIIADCVTAAIQLTVGVNRRLFIEGNTLYGAENKLGVGIDVASGACAIEARNNIIVGFVTGYDVTDSTNTTIHGDYNVYYNNTTDVVNTRKGTNDIAIDPAFSDVAQLTGSTATTSASVLTQTGANFSTVTDDSDFVYIKSGTGVTAAKYLITAHTTDTLTLSSAPGNSSAGDVVWQVTTGCNYAVTGAI